MFRIVATPRILTSAATLATPVSAALQRRSGVPRDGMRCSPGARGRVRDEKGYAVFDPWSRVRVPTARARRWVSPGRQLLAGLAVGLVAAAVAVVVAPVPASAAVPGLQYVTASTGSDSFVYKSVRVFCPAGTQVVGGGYELVGAEGSVVLDDFIPAANSMLVGAGEVVGPGEPADGTTESWQVRATAVCANPLPGYSIVSDTSAFTQGFSRSALASCPTGTPAIGGGASLSNGFGQISITDLHVSGGSASVRAIDDEDGYSGSWSVTAYAICANALPGLRTVGSASGAGSTSLRAVTAPCRPAQQVLGAGWSVFQGAIATEQLLNIHASVSGGGAAPGVTALGSEDANGFSGDWRVVAYAVCADG